MFVHCNVAKVLPSGRPAQINLALASVTWAGAAVLMIMVMMMMMAMAMAMNMVAMAAAVALMAMMMDGALDARSVATHATELKTDKEDRVEMKSQKTGNTIRQQAHHQWNTD